MGVWTIACCQGVRIGTQRTTDLVLCEQIVGGTPGFVIDGTRREGEWVEGHRQHEDGPGFLKWSPSDLPEATEGSRIPPQGLVPRASAQTALRLPILKNARDSLDMPTPHIIRDKSKRRTAPWPLTTSDHRPILPDPDMKSVAIAVSNTSRANGGSCLRTPRRASAVRQGHDACGWKHDRSVASRCARTQSLRNRPSPAVDVDESLGDA